MFSYFIAFLYFIIIILSYNLFNRSNIFCSKTIIQQIFRWNNSQRPPSQPTHTQNIWERATRKSSGKSYLTSTWDHKLIWVDFSNCTWKFSLRISNKEINNKNSNWVQDWRKEKCSKIVAKTLILPRTSRAIFRKTLNTERVNITRHFGKPVSTFDKNVEFTALMTP